MTKHSHFPYTSTYSSTPHNTNRKHNIHHIHYTNTQHTSRLQGLKTLFLTTATTQKHSTTTDIKTNMCHIHTYIVSRHLATRGNNKILHTLHHTLAALQRYFPASLGAPLPNPEQTNLPCSNHTYTKLMPNHMHHDYAPSATPTHHLFNCIHIRTTLLSLVIYIYIYIVIPVSLSLFEVSHI